MASLRAHGWRLDQGGQRISAPCQASDDPAELGVQDLVVIAVKAPALSAVAQRIAPLLGPATLVLPAMNGVPWWFSAPALGLEPLDSVDPGGRIAAAIPVAQVIGCVVHVSAATPEPGLVAHAKGQGLILGEPLAGMVSANSDNPDGASARVQALANLLTRAGFEVSVSANVRQDIWYKLLGNMTVNPITAITGATTDRVVDDPLVLAFCSAAMREAMAVGARIGCAVHQSPDERHAVTRKLGAFKPSMLQDVEAGRPIELDAIVTAVHEIGRRLGVATPNIDALLGLTRLFGRVRGLYPPA